MSQATSPFAKLLWLLLWPVIVSVVCLTLTVLSACVSARHGLYCTGVHVGWRGGRCVDMTSVGRSCSTRGQVLTSSWLSVSRCCWLSSLSSSL